jgi:hypothetical protein
LPASLKIERRAPEQLGYTPKMRILLRLFARSTLAEPALGRWQLAYIPQIINKKIDQANEDHCGCCQVQEHMIVKVDKSDEYLEPFVYYS